jgi:hypothetical protein
MSHRPVKGCDKPFVQVVVLRQEGNANAEIPAFAKGCADGPLPGMESLAEITVPSNSVE